MNCSLLLLKILFILSSQQTNANNRSPEKYIENIITFLKRRKIKICFHWRRDVFSSYYFCDDKGWSNYGKKEETWKIKEIENRSFFYWYRIISLFWEYLKLLYDNRKRFYIKFYIIINRLHWINNQDSSWRTWAACFYY